MRTRDTKVRLKPLVAAVTPTNLIVVCDQLQEATLSALAALAKDNTTLTAVLSRPSPDPECMSTQHLHSLKPVFDEHRSVHQSHRLCRSFYLCPKFVQPMSR